MKELIRKILHEALVVTDDTPDWVKKFHVLSREGRIEFIKDYKKEIERFLPMVEEFFKSKYGDSLKKFDVVYKKAYYGNESFSIEKLTLKFFFEVDKMTSGRIIKQEIYKDLKSFFSIDVTYYGTPLEYEVYEMTWNKV
jgi:hypothetical protein